jgi:rsbT co-antagonist protein RsbR
MDFGVAASAEELLQQSPFAAIRVDTAAKIAWWNHKAGALLGLTGEDHGRAIAEVAGEIEDGSWAALLAAADGAVAVSQRHDRGEPLRCEWRLQPQGPGGALCFGLDITARTREERQISTERSVLRALLDTLPMSAWVLDPDGNYLLSDGKGLEFVGAKPGQLVGLNAFEVFSAIPDALAVLRRGLEGEAACYPASTADYEFDTWQVPVFDANGKVTKLIGISLEVTELKRTSRELQSKLDVIERQNQAIRDLSTPIIEVWDRILTLPIVGLVDSARTAEIMERLLTAVVHHRARYAILDLTGVEVVDTSTASHILALIRTIRLLGAEGLLTGIHPSIAQTIVNLGVDLSGLIVRSTLRDALQHCIVQMARQRPAGGKP